MAKSTTGKSGGTSGSTSKKTAAKTGKPAAATAKPKPAAGTTSKTTQAKAQAQAAADKAEKLAKDAKANIAPDAKPIAPETKPAKPEPAKADPKPKAAAETPKAEPAKADPVKAEAPKPSTPASPPPAPVHTVERKGGFVPMVFGGLVAGAIGFGAAYTLLPQGDDGLSEQVTTQGANLTELQDRLAKVESTATGAAEAAAAIDLAPVTDSVAALETQVGETAAASDDIAASVAEVATRFDALDERLTALEKRPVEESVSPEAIEAYERELAALQEAMATERASIEELLEAQKAEVARIADEASQMEERALERQKQAAVREALARVQVALDGGTPFADALADLTEAGVDVPEALSAVAADGVATAASLRDTFPDAAREALTAARASGSEGSGGSIADIIKAQLGARSTTPQEGDSADAVLSRMEAAVKEDRIADALAEADSLTDDARAALDDWIARATARMNAVAAASDLAQSLS